MPLKIAVLFDGAGLARLGLEEAGHHCTGFELDPIAYYLGRGVGSGRVKLQDVREVDLSPYDAVWASPPCQIRSIARTQGAPERTKYSHGYLEWSLALKTDILWVENVCGPKKEHRLWGTVYNAGQFTLKPRQNRNRVIGGRYKPPRVFRKHKWVFKGACPSILATEYKGCATDPRRASRFYGRRLTIEECAYRQGLVIPKKWHRKPRWFKKAPHIWRQHLYRAIGNGVPTYMSKSFGYAYASNSWKRGKG